jgi:hypothetical protein
MLIKEIGLVFRGFLLSQIKFDDRYEINIENLKGAFLSAVLSFSRNLFCEELFYIECKNYAIAFHCGEIKSCEKKCFEKLITYAIIDKEKIKRTERTIEKKIRPKLDDILNLFIKKYNGTNLINLNLFDTFKSEIEVLMKN